VETAYTHALHTCAVHFIRWSQQSRRSSSALHKISFSLRKLVISAAATQRHPRSESVGTESTGLAPPGSNSQDNYWYRTC